MGVSGLKNSELLVRELGETLESDLREFRLSMLHDDPSVQYDEQSNTLHKEVSAKSILQDDYMDYQLQQTPEWMGLSVIEMARKAIMYSDLSVNNKIMAIKDIAQYFKRYKDVCHSIQQTDFHEGIAMADHAREYIYDLLLEYGVIQNRMAFNQLRNAGVMWRLFDRMAVQTHIAFDNQDDVKIESESWKMAHPEQDRLLIKKAGEVVKGMSSADKVIKRVQLSLIESQDPMRLVTGSQERDWYATNAQVTRYQKDGVPALTCWTNGDLRSKTKYYDQTLVKQILKLNMKQLVLNATGIKLDHEDEIHRQQFCQSKDVFGRNIQLKPICVLNDCQSYINEKHYGAKTSKMIRGIPVVGAMLEEEHQNLLQRDEAITEVNQALSESIGLDDFLIPLNTPLAVHGRKYFTYVADQVPSIERIMTRLIDNYATILCLDQQEMEQVVGSRSEQLKSMVAHFLEHPSHERLTPVTAALTAMHQHAMQFYGQDFAQSDQVAKVVRSLACLNNTMKHYQVYANSRKNYPHEVLNFSSSLMTSVALLNDGTMVNIKCKSGKDRTGVMKQCVQANYDYWTDTIRCDQNQGLPEMTDHFDCDQKQSLEKLKVLLGSGAWTTAVAQDCQCPALKSLGSPLSGLKRGNTLQDKTLNLIGDGALSEKQRAFIGQDMLRYQKQRSAMNGDFHKQVSGGKSFRNAYQSVKEKFMETAHRRKNTNRFGQK